MSCSWRSSGETEARESTAARIVATGVRSSCEALPTNSDFIAAARAKSVTSRTTSKVDIPCSPRGMTRAARRSRTTLPAACSNSICRRAEAPAGFPSSSLMVSSGAGDADDRLDIPADGAFLTRRQQRRGRIVHEDDPLVAIQRHNAFPQVRQYGREVFALCGDSLYLPVQTGPHLVQGLGQLPEFARLSQPDSPVKPAGGDASRRG